MRTVICHYHIYKNSGTTFDRILSANFGERHVCFDGPFPYFSIHQQELAKVIARNRSAVAFSSHQIALPVPASLEFNVLPVVFIRHPVLRIKSIYKFKRSEQDGTETSRLAGELDFDAWCAHSLSHPLEITHVSNAQTKLVGGTTGQPSLSRRVAKRMVYDLAQAKRNLGAVELLARTEWFDEDVGRFSSVLAGHGIAFEAGDTTPQNVTSDDFHETVEQRVERVLATLSGETREALLAANQQDLSLYDWVGRKLGTSN